MIKGSFSNRMRLIGPSIVCLGFHAGEQGDLGRHLLEQVMVDCRSGYIRAEGDQPDGEGDVSVFGGELNVDPARLEEFKEMVCKDFVGIGSYLTYIFPSTKKLTLPL